MTHRTDFRSIALFTFLVVSSAAAQQSTTPAKTNLVAKDYSFNIDAKHVWLDTQAEYSERRSRTCLRWGVGLYGPLAGKAAFAAALGPSGVLLMKLHAEDKPVLATPDAELPAIDNASRLYLGVNGSQCSGKLSARVQIEKPQP